MFHVKHRKESNMKVKVKDIVQMASALIAITHFEGTTYDEDEAIELAQKIIDNSTNEYEKGWQDALRMALEGGTENNYNDLVVYEDHIRALMLSHNETAVNLEREVEI